jgi:hypothetical protein
MAVAFPRRTQHRAHAFGQPRCRPHQPHWLPAWWHGRDVDTMFLKYGYRPHIHNVDPMRVLVYYLQA